MTQIPFRTHGSTGNSMAIATASYATNTAKDEKCKNINVSTHNSFADSYKRLSMAVIFAP
ncbi:hypothetical protein [Calothrix sp. NIES-2098]|uniref:hypothetical protein n=1 Tax=Calothrix sp. NIES-2098 TaxID=1954171 RepID=UPI000B5DBD5B|nr:hypothetical protein NIES2098_20450 [Calothrix sp. NIES-2098]